MLVVGSSSWLTLCTMPPPACTFIGLMTVPLMMGFFVLGSTAEELTVSASDDSLQQQHCRQELFMQQAPCHLNSQIQVGQRQHTLAHMRITDASDMRLRAKQRCQQAICTHRYLNLRGQYTGTIFLPSAFLVTSMLGLLYSLRSCVVLYTPVTQDTCDTPQQCNVTPQCCQCYTVMYITSYMLSGFNSLPDDSVYTALDCGCSAMLQQCCHLRQPVVLL
jgi:hypothetical protein